LGLLHGSGLYPLQQHILVSGLIVLACPAQILAVHNFHFCGHGRFSTDMAGFGRFDSCHLRGGNLGGCLSPFLNFLKSNINYDLVRSLPRIKEK